MRILVLLLVFLLSAAPAYAQGYVAISFHDVVDDQHDLGPDDITTRQLTAFFDWLAGNGWSPVSLDDIEAARSGQKPLPPNAILLTFDDGYAGHYSRVYPLLRAYGFHAVFFLVGSWMEGRPDGTVRYGDRDVPRNQFLSWEQAREMAASGLAEFGSHSWDLHRGIRGNPQGSSPPSAATWAYDPKTGRYETDDALQFRVFADLQRSIELMRLRLGRAPRSLAWPFGRTSGPALAAARQAGFTTIMGLAAEPADTSRPLDIQRLYPTQNPTLNTITTALRVDYPDPEQRRLVCVSLDRVAGNTDAESVAALGKTIEDIRRLGPRTVLLDAFPAGKPGEPIRSAWFESSLLPTKADFLGFAAWQIRSRAGVDVVLRIDLAAAAASVGTEHVGELVRELIRAAPVDGIAIDPPGPFLAGSSEHVPFHAWRVRAERDRVTSADGDSPNDHLAIQVWKVAEQERPGLRLDIVGSLPLPGKWPAVAADVVLLKQADEGLVAAVRGMASRGRLDPDVSSRLALPLPADKPHTAVEEMRQAQALGASAFALCPAPALPTDAAVSAAFSISRFPRLP
jgi:peptidoglycan/xylan/chitin deacetylase (PgdA/CDA1 family)